MTFTVKQARCYAGLSQAQMAEKMLISRDVYRNIEAHPERATIKQAQEIAEITGIDINLIFFGLTSTKSRV